MPTREILIDLSNDSFEGLIDGNGRFTAIPSLARINGASVVLPVPLTQDIVDGEFVAPVFLQVTDGDPQVWAWQIRIFDEHDTPMATRYVFVPAGTGPIPVGDLPVVDKCTLDPDADPEAAWWVALQNFQPSQEAIEAALEGQDLATVPYVDQQIATIELTPGDPGAPGPSAYEVAVANGFVGTEAEWLVSLEGADGEDGADSTVPGPPGPSAYQVWLDAGNTGTAEDFLASLEGEPGSDATVVKASTAEAQAMASEDVVLTPKNLADVSVTTPTGDRIPRYTGAQQLRVALSPTGPTDGVSKSYLESQISLYGIAPFTPSTINTDFVNTGWGKLSLAAGATPYSYTGLAEWSEANLSSTTLLVRSITAYGTDGAFYGTHEHRLYGTGRDGKLLEARRVRLYTGSSWGAWGPWQNIEVDELGGGGGGGLKTYASEAEFLAETETSMGVLSPATNWGAFSGINTGGDSLGPFTGPALVSTVMMLKGGVVAGLQTVTIAESVGLYGTKRIRRVLGAGGWSAWTFDIKLPVHPTEVYDAATKGYVDGKALNNIEWPALDTLDETRTHVGLVSDPGFDLGAATGIAKYDGRLYQSLWYVAHGGYTTSAFDVSQVQQVWVHNFDGTVDEIRRTRENFGTWSAWAIYTPPSGGGGGDPVGRYVAINGQTGTTYGPVVADEGKLVTLNNAAPITVTIPTDAAQAIPVGAIINFLVIGAGMATFVAGSPPSLIVPTGYTSVTRAQGSQVSLTKIGPDSWSLVGDLAAVP